MVVQAPDRGREIGDEGEQKRSDPRADAPVAILSSMSGAASTSRKSEPEDRNHRGRVELDEEEPIFPPRRPAPEVERLPPRPQHPIEQALSSPQNARRINPALSESQPESAAKPPRPSALTLPFVPIEIMSPRSENEPRLLADFFRLDPGKLLCGSAIPRLTCISKMLNYLVEAIPAH